jgi:hypothetical protein
MTSSMVEGNKPTPHGAENAWSRPWTLPSGPETTSTFPPWPAPRKSTAASSTDTVTCLNASTPLPTHPSRRDDRLPSAEPPCRPIWQTPWSGTPVWPRVRQLEKRLSAQLGEQAWSESGLGSLPDIDQLQRHIAMLVQELAEERGNIEERTDELEAARAANRELTRALNQARSGRDQLST